MLSLKQALASRNYCDLGLLAHLHGLPMSRSRPKAQSIQRLYAHIKQHKTFMRVYRTLGKRAKDIRHKAGASCEYNHHSVLHHEIEGNFSV